MVGFNDNEVAAAFIDVRATLATISRNDERDFF